MSFLRKFSFSIISTSAAVGLSTALSPARAQFSGFYAPSNWTTTNFNSDGNVNTSGAPSSILITGPNNGSLSSGYTQYTTTARKAGLYTFSWNYNTVDTIGYDDPKFVVNGASANIQGYNRFGSQSQNGAASYTLALGDTFGFQAYSFDNDVGSATLNIFDFLYPNPGLAYSSTLQPYADMQSIGLDALKNQRELVLNQAGDCDQKGWVVYDSNKTKATSKTKKNQSLCVFAEGGYATGTINGTDTLAGYSTGNASSAYGVEWKLSKQWAVGASYGYGTTNLSNFNFQDTTSSISSNINSGNVYGVYRPDNHWKIAALFGYSDFSYSGSRTYLGDTANAKYSASGYTAALQASHDIPLSRDYNNKKNPLSPVRLKPLVGLAWGANQQGSFSESGSGTLVNVQGQTTNSLMGTVGVGLEAPILLNRKKSMVLTPRVGAAYQYDFLANQASNKSITANLQDDPTTSYTEAGQNRGANNAYLDLGSDFQLNPQVALFASVNYQVFTNGDQFGYQGGVRVKF